MSNTGNEFERPGINYPDREDIEGVEPAAGEPRREDDADSADAMTQRPAGHDADHHGQDGGRDTLTVDEAQRTGGLSTGPGNTQDLPAMDQNNATVEEKIRGIVIQTRQDLAMGTRETVEEMLQSRLADAGIDASDDDVATLAEQVRVD